MNILEFMASNGLVANQSKTEFLLLNEKENDPVGLKEVKVGNTMVQRTNETRLLGVIIEDSQEWSSQVKKLKSSLNQRLFVIRRVARQLPKHKIMNVVHSLWMSKLRYGLQLCSEVRLTNEDKKPFIMKELQLTQNRMLRLINNSKIKDKISIESMLDKFNLPSVNQLAATIKLQEVWKSINVPGCPIKLEPYKKMSTISMNLEHPKTEYSRTQPD